MPTTGTTHLELDSGSSETISDVRVAINYFIHSVALYVKGMFRLELPYMLLEIIFWIHMDKEEADYVCIHIIGAPKLQMVHRAPWFFKGPVFPNIKSPTPSPNRNSISSPGCRDNNWITLRKPQCYPFTSRLFAVYCLSQRKRRRRRLKLSAERRSKKKLPDLLWGKGSRTTSSELTKQIQYCSLLLLILWVVGERGDSADKSKSTWQRRFAVLICLLCARHGRVLRAAARSARKFASNTRKKHQLTHWEISKDCGHRCNGGMMAELFSRGRVSSYFPGRKLLYLISEQKTCWTEGESVGERQTEQSCCFLLKHTHTLWKKHW